MWLCFTPVEFRAPSLLKTPKTSDLVLVDPSYSYGDTRLAVVKKRSSEVFSTCFGDVHGTLFVQTPCYRVSVLTALLQFLLNGQFMYCSIKTFDSCPFTCPKFICPLFSTKLFECG